MRLRPSGPLRRAVLKLDIEKEFSGPAPALGLFEMSPARNQVTFLFVRVAGTTRYERG